VSGDAKMNPVDEPPKAIRIFWSGPHTWPGFESQNRLPPLPKHSGIYLLTFLYQDGFLIYVAGLTRRPFRLRFAEHTREYLRGAYNVLDPVQAQNGVRFEIWQGWGYWRAHRDEFAARQSEVQVAVKRQLAAFCVGALSRLPAPLMTGAIAQALSLPAAFAAFALAPATTVPAAGIVASLGLAR
jgi:hypothetical protein